MENNNKKHTSQNQRKERKPINDTMVTENLVTEEPVVQEPVTEEPIAEEPVKDLAVVANCTAVRLREQASLNSKQICIMPAGTIVEILERGNTFDHVKLMSGEIGYVVNDFIKR